MTTGHTGTVPFEHRGGILHAEGVPLPVLAERFGTPLYVYSEAAIVSAYRGMEAALAGLPFRIAYAVKANSNLAILALLARQGAGFDIVSGGELERVLAAGAPAERVVFSGVGKTRPEIERALRAGVDCFNVESESELGRIAAVATACGLTARIALRINPDVDPRTHPYIATGLKKSKFGIPLERARACYHLARTLPGIAISGIDCHIGSQIAELGPYAEALDAVLDLHRQLRADGIAIDHIDLGGGFGVRYRDEEPFDVAAWAALLRQHFGGAGSPLLVFEPGRSLVAGAGCLLTRVEILKPGPVRNFAVVDAAMNDLLRPALYDAWHPVDPVCPRTGEPVLPWEIVGPICESGDFLAHERPLALHEGDLLAIGMAGAYGMAMSSNYNSRPRAAEVLVSGGDASLVRRRESLDDLLRAERF